MGNSSHFRDLIDQLYKYFNDIDFEGLKTILASELHEPFDALFSNPDPNFKSTFTPRLVLVEDNKALAIVDKRDEALKAVNSKRYPTLKLPGGFVLTHQLCAYFEMENGLISRSEVIVDDTIEQILGNQDLKYELQKKSHFNIDEYITILRENGLIS